MHTEIPATDPYAGVRRVSDWFRRAFPFLLLVAIALGLLIPAPAEVIKPLNLMCIGLLIFFPSLKVNWAEVLSYFKRGAGLLALSMLIMFVVLPGLIFLAGRAVGLDPVILIGLTIISTSPGLLSVPYLTGLLKGDLPLSWGLTLLSTLLSPLVVWLAARLLSGDVLHLNLTSLVSTIIAVLVVPVGVALIAQRTMPGAVSWLVAGEHIGATLSIVFINFTVMSLNRGLIFGLAAGVFVFLILVGLFQDFGVYAITRKLATPLVGAPAARSMAISYAMRNVGLVGGVLVLQDSRLALAAGMISFAHVLMFAAVSRLGEKM